MSVNSVIRIATAESPAKYTSISRRNKGHSFGLFPQVLGTTQTSTPWVPEGFP